MSEVVVFAGPSLPPGDPERDGRDLAFRPPAAQGDVLRAALRGPSAIVLIDGYFRDVPAVYHKEVLWALSQGIAVYGAASMGALRAAELWSFGMVGVGQVFEDYRDGHLTRDDEVALAHAPEPLGFLALSEPLVNIRATLAAAVSSGRASEVEAERIAGEMAALHYPDRTRNSLAAACRDPALAQALDAGWVDRKRLDAVACLERVTADRKGGTWPAPPAFAFNHTDAFESLVRETASSLDAEDAPDVLAALDPQRYRALRQDAAITALAAKLGELRREGPGPAAMMAAVTAFRQQEGLPDAASLGRWLADRRIDIDTLSKYLDSRIKTDHQLAQIEDEVTRHLIAALRIAGHIR